MATKNLDEIFDFADQDPNFNQDGSFNFENFMKTIGNLSYSSMFQDDGTMKKFIFKNIDEKIQ